MILIPTFIDNQNISDEEKIRLGREYTRLMMNGDIKLEGKKESKSITGENMKDPEIGILVGPNNKKRHRFNGSYFAFFLKVYEAYNQDMPPGSNPKRNAAWAFYDRMIIQGELNQYETADERNVFAQKLINAARQQNRLNLDIKENGSTPIQMQGWISQGRYEDFF